VELLKEIRAARPRLAVLVLSSHPDSQFARRALRAGAAGYVTKDNPPEVLLHATRTVLAGGKYVSSELAAHLATEFAATEAKLPHELLSDREYIVMLRIASGQGVTKVAEALRLSVKTVSTYRSRILEKMELGSNAELTQYAFRNKLIE
jgi:DNA-binding NarL/FixJ family response regulator